MTLHLAAVASPIGELVVAVRAGRLCALGFADGRGVRGVAARGEEVVHGSDPAGVGDRLAGYFAGALEALDDLAIAPGGTAFQQAVWAALRRIPAGRTASYAEVARAIGAPAAVRAVGAANGANPIAIVVPCHRVVGSDGSLTGYAGGLERKRWLLAHEAAARPLPRDAPLRAPG